MGRRPLLDLIRATRLPRFLLASALMLGSTALALTLTPASHDFGDVGLKADVFFEFQVSVPTATPQGTVLTPTITGPDAGDFSASAPQEPLHDCQQGPQGFRCLVSAKFRPNSLGPKAAVLEVADNHGNRATAQLKGNGVNSICEMKVVFCNYGFRYSGTFAWTKALSGPFGQDSAWATVNVTNGSAVCTGGATSVGQGNSSRGTVMGKGLFAVEWLEDPMYPWVYQITAACPTANWPPGPNGEAGTPSRPAELGHNDMTTFPQPDPRIRPGWTLEQAVASITTLQGSLRYPAPETDPLNGLSGVVTVFWNLCPKVDSLGVDKLGRVIWRCP